MNARSSSLKSWRASFSSSRSARRRVSKRSCSARMPAWYAADVSSFMALLLREEHRLRRLDVDMQLEQVRARVVADDIEIAPRDCDPLEVDLRVEDAQCLAQRPGNDLAPRGDDDRIARVDPLVRVGKQLRLAGDGVRDVAPLEGAAAAEYPATAFAGDVLHRRDRALAAVVGRRDIDIDPLRVQGAARERHVALPADQRADAPAWRVDGFQAGGVAEAPDHALGAGRHDLAVPVQERAVGPDRDNSVVQRGPAEVGVELVDAAYDADLAAPGCLAQRREIVAGQVDRVGERRRAIEEDRRLLNDGDARHGAGLLSDIFVNAERVAFGVLEPCGLFRAEHGDVIDGLESRQIVVGEHHAARLERADRGGDVFDLEAQGRMRGLGAARFREERDLGSAAAVYEFAARLGADGFEPELLAVEAPGA